MPQISVSARSPDSQTAPAQLAYDRIASSYEQQVAGDAWMRRILWRHYLSVFRPGDRVLDVACGTGLDARYLADHGIHVTAIDVAPGMIDQLKQRDAAGDIDARVLSIAGLADLPAATFDGIVSAFAGLNTIPDLHDFARDAARLLRPNGRMVLHLLNRFSLWEWLALVKRREWDEARAVGRSAERDFIIGGVPVKHYVYEPLALYRAVFAGAFLLESVYGLGSLRHPHTIRAVPEPVSEALGALEYRFGNRRPLLNRGRFFVLDLIKRPEATDGD
jgi:SAM-dependent methyltransferase